MTFGIEEVYGMHNMPALPVGSFKLRKGPLMAAADEITIIVEGQGGHGAMPHQCIDPVVVGAQIVVALQTIASRNVDPLDSCVVSVTRFAAGTANNIIPQSAWLNGTVRTLKPATRDAVEKRIHEIAAGLAAAGGATARVEYRRNYPSTVNHGAQTDFAARSRAKSQATPMSIRTPIRSWARRISPSCSRRARARSSSSATATPPSSIIPAYDFNDAALPYGMSYWVELVETALAPQR